MCLDRLETVARMDSRHFLDSRLSALPRQTVARQDSSPTDGNPIGQEPYRLVTGVCLSDKMIPIYFLCLSKIWNI